MIDDAVTLYSRPKEFVAPAHAVLYGEKESKDGRRRFVGCMGWNCASSGVDRQGFWGFPGKVRRALSPIEEMLLGQGCRNIQSVQDRRSDLRQTRRVEGRETSRAEQSARLFLERRKHEGQML